MTKTEELLKVLDLPEEEQVKFIYKYDGISNYCKALAVNKRWGDLAFRLRDEVCKDSLACDNYRKALHIVYRSFRKSQEGTIRQNLIPYELWLESFITAIERIIAVLIAKKLASEEKP